MAVPSRVWVGGLHKPTLDTPLDWSSSVGTLIFSSYVGLGPASTVYQKKKILGISGKYLKFLQPQKLSEPTYVSKYPHPRLSIRLYYKAVK